MQFHSIVLVASAAPLFAQTAHSVVPAAYHSIDANSYLWIAGASQDVRQQTLIGEAHLTGLTGRLLTGLELRRTAANEVYAGGVASLTVDLSISPRRPLACSDVYLQNAGAPTRIFSGLVTLPTSPVQLGPTVAWANDTTVTITFSQPFVYNGGTLCIDVVGHALAGQTADWWMADAVFEDITGTVTDTGDGCGYYGGPSHHWSWVAPRSLLPGALAHFSAQGTPLGLGMIMFGQPAAAPIPVSSFGLSAPPGCNFHIEPSTIISALFLVFVPETDPNLLARGGFADSRFWIPDSPWTFGLQLTTQWVDLSQQFAASNALTWTVAGSIPTLDLAFVDGSPLDTRGNATVHIAPVWRIAHRAP